MKNKRLPEKESNLLTVLELLCGMFIAEAAEQCKIEKVSVTTDPVILSVMTTHAIARRLNSPTSNNSGAKAEHKRKLKYFKAKVAKLLNHNFGV